MITGLDMLLTMISCICGVRTHYYKFAPVPHALMPLKTSHQSSVFATEAASGFLSGKQPSKAEYSLNFAPLRTPPAVKFSQPIFPLLKSLTLTLRLSGEDY